jgi:hypothetical protein
MTDDPLDALFDDELEDLTTSARRLLGEDAVIAAVDRASARLGAGGVTSVEDLPRLREALKAELRRLITRH